MTQNGLLDASGSGSGSSSGEYPAVISPPSRPSATQPRDDENAGALTFYEETCQLLIKIFL